MKGQGSGWRNESRRHSLARKGIKTASGSFIISGNEIIKKDHDYGYPTREMAEQRLAEMQKAHDEFWTPERLQAKKEIDDAIKKEKDLREMRFTTRVVSENSFGVVDDYGNRENLMIFHPDSNQDNYSFIEWAVLDDDGEVIDYAEIGIFTEGKKVVDYDGVFELPIQAIQLLKKNGFNTKDVE